MGASRNVNMAFIHSLNHANRPRCERAAPVSHGPRRSLNSLALSHKFRVMINSRWVVGGASLFTLLAGCALQTGEAPNEGEENVASASTEQALLGGWATGPFQWSQGQ